MRYPKIDWDLCQLCEPCQARRVCKPRAIVQMDEGEPPYIELDRCQACALCVSACCCGAISYESPVKTTRIDH